VITAIRGRRGADLTTEARRHGEGDKWGKNSPNALKRGTTKYTKNTKRGEEFTAKKDVLVGSVWDFGFWIGDSAGGTGSEHGQVGDRWEEWEEWELCEDTAEVWFGGRD
jgi:hypothetical protein